MPEPKPEPEPEPEPELETVSFEVDDRTYLSDLSEPLTQQEAQRRCELHGGTLIELYNQQQLNNVV